MSLPNQKKPQPKTAPKAAVKTSTKPQPKFKSKKLEERIAPGMLGSGIIDPGAAEGFDNSSDANNGESEFGSETRTDSFNYNSQPQGQYLEDLPPNAQPTHVDNFHGGENQDAPKIDMEQQDEFYSGTNNDAGTFAEETPAWQESPWIESHADGSFDITPPEGVSIDGGIANFPLDIANSELPMPEQVELQADGSMNVECPEGTQFSEELNALVVPEGSVAIDQVPEYFNAYEAQDGSIVVPLPEDGCNWHAENNTINFSNDIVNELTPQNVEVNEDGSVAVTLPEEGVQYNQDGSIHFDAEAAAYMDNPPPAFYGEMDYAEFNADGSLTFSPPEGCEVENGIATIEAAVVNDVLPFPEEVTFNADGGMTYELPENTQYNEEYNYLTVPAGEINLNDVPENFNPQINPDGTLTAYLPEGVQYEAGSLVFTNEAANAVLDDNIALMEDGSVTIALPETTAYYKDGDFSIPAGDLDFAVAETPSFVGDVDFAVVNANGDYVCTPPTEFRIDSQEGTCTVSAEYIQSEYQEYIPDDVTFNPDGTMTCEVPDGSYNTANNSLSFAPDKIELQELPSGIQWEYSADGKIEVFLPEGIQYDAQTNTVTMDNYWTNEFTPSHVEYQPDGQFQVDLPSDCQYQGGQVIIPESSADFMNYPDPTWASGPDFIESNPDGSITCEKYEGIQINAENGYAEFKLDTLPQFEHMIPEYVEFSPEGNLLIEVPANSYDPATDSLKLPIDDFHPNDIPEGINYNILPDGQVQVFLPEGIDYDAASSQLKCDNYWTNECLPEAVTVTEGGEFQVQLPPDTYYHADGSITIPEYQADFINEPCADYVNNGPEWVESNPNGSVTVEYPAGCEVNATTGEFTMPYNVAMEAFDDQIPDDMKIYQDGSMDLKAPEGTVYDAANDTCTFPAGEVHGHEIPEGIKWEMLESGAIKVDLPEGIDYNAQSGTFHFNNSWANEMIPEPITINPDGSFDIKLPEDTQYHDGSFTISPQSADFLEDHEPVVEQAPEWHETEWVEAQPDGSYDVALPEGVQVNDGVANFPLEIANAELPLPEYVEFQADGSMNVECPNGTQYSEELNALIIPEGRVDVEQVPEYFNAYEAQDGTIIVTLPEDGCNWNAETNTINFSNDVVNEFVPANVEVYENGSVAITLPEDGVQYNANGTIHFEAEAAAYMENPPAEYLAELDYAEFNADGSMTFTTPEGVVIDNGYAAIEAGSVNEVLPLPEEIKFTADGGMSYELPQNTHYHADYNYVTVPAGEINLNDVPENFNPQINPDGTLTAYLPQGVEYNEGNLVFNNEAANTVLPESISIEADGSVTVALPENTEFTKDGDFTIPAGDLDFATYETPAFLGEADFVEVNAYGDYICTPPADFQINAEAGTCTVSAEYVQAEFQDQIPEEVTFNSDGTMTVEVNNATYDTASNSLTFEADKFNPSDVPSGIQWEYKGEGQYQVFLPEGIQYDSASQSVTMDNYWTNEFTPSHVEYQTDGNFQVDLPSDCQYQGGQVIIPEASVDFMNYPDPTWATGPDFIESNPDGSITCAQYDGITVNATEGYAEFKLDTLPQFENMIPEYVEFTPEGNLLIEIPANSYDAATDSVKLPMNEFHPNEIPEGINYNILPNGQVQVFLPEGIDYDAASGQLKCDNYWTNECLPEAVTVNEGGEFQVQLPPNTYYHADGSFTVPEYQSDFIHEPSPEYTHNGPEWVDSNPNGSVTVDYPQGCEVDATAGEFTMPYNVAMEAFDDQIPDDMKIYQDGSMDLKAPEGTLYDAASDTCIFPAGEVHGHEIPEGIKWELTNNGSIKIELPEGIDFNSQSGTFHFNNQWANEMIPEPITIKIDGSFEIKLPEDTQYHNGSFTLTPHSADFLNDDHGHHPPQAPHQRVSA